LGKVGWGYSQALLMNFSGQKAKKLVKFGYAVLNVDVGHWKLTSVYDNL
jgi:hypothetical protein